MGYIKPKKARARLAARQAAWDGIRPDNVIGANVKVIHKPCGAVLAYTKPGSLRK